MIIYIIYAILFVALFIYARIKENMLTKKHQEEWDKIKANLPKSVMITQNTCRDYSECELISMKIDAYLKYISSLKYHWLVGNCLPRM